jgi:hypothetical protein
MDPAVAREASAVRNATNAKPIFTGLVAMCTALTERRVMTMVDVAQGASASVLWDSLGLTAQSVRPRVVKTYFPRDISGKPANRLAYGTRHAPSRADALARGIASAARTSALRIVNIALPNILAQAAVMSAGRARPALVMVAVTATVHA